MLIFLFFQHGFKMIKMRPKWSRGPIWGEDGSGEGKRRVRQVSLNPFWSSFFATLDHFFRCLFLMLFWKASFSPLGRLLGAQGAQKGAKMEPKWKPKRSWGHLLGSVKSIAGVMISAHEGGSGRVWEATFSRPGLQTNSGGVLGSIFADLK